MELTREMGLHMGEFPCHRSTTAEDRCRALIVTDHLFGNSSTDLKLEVIEEYLKAYVTALRPHFKHLWYIDAFAGTGVRSVDHSAGFDFVGGEYRHAFSEQRRGSARIAIDARPSFDRLTFIDQKPGHVLALQALAAEHPAASMWFASTATSSSRRRSPGKTGRANAR